MTMLLRRLRPSLLLAILSLAVSCRGDGTTGPGGRFGDPLSIRVVAGGGTSDTIGTYLQQALIVEVRDSAGLVAPGVIARFEALPSDDPKRLYESTLSVSSLLGNAYSYFASTPTDTDGRAKVLVQLGTVAGTARLRVSVPELGLVDTVPFAVTPGAATHILIGTRDTTVQPGATYSLNLSLADRAWNPLLGGTFHFSVKSGTAQVSAAGQVTVGSGIAATTIEVAWQNVTDVAHVTVLPKIQMVGVRTGSVRTVVLVNTDGSDERDLATSNDQSLSPHTVAASDNVVYYQGNPSVSAQVWIASPTGSPKVLAGQANGFTSAAWPRLSPDGQWVYFISQSGIANAFSLWRIRPDGSGLDSLASGTAVYYRNLAPAISPDGSTVVAGDADSTMFVTPATKAVSMKPVGCPAARYSPDGSRLACINGSSLAVMNADGSAFRVLGTAYNEILGVDWSPDGEWLVANTLTLQLVNATDGTALTLTPLGLDHRQLLFVR